MNVRFFMLQAQYRSTLDFSNDALKAAQKGYLKLVNGLRYIKKMEYPIELNSEIELKEEHKIEIDKAIQGTFDGINDDLNTAVSIAHLFNLLKKINQLYSGQLAYETVGEEGFNKLKSHFVLFIENILGLKEEINNQSDEILNGMLALYGEFKEKRKYDKIDQIRAYFKANKLVIKDMKTKIDWAYDEL